MMNPAGLPGAGVSAGTTARWYTNPAILMPGGLLLVYVNIKCTSCFLFVFSQFFS